MNIDTIIREVQTALKLTPDGKAGPVTWAAVYDKIVGKKAPDEHAPSITWPVDDRSETNIATLHPKVQSYARALILRAKDSGITIKIISGTRSYDEQAKLYAQGRTEPGKRVTNAGPGYSNHNFGLAFDIGVFSGNRYLEESPAYKAVGALGIELGLEWGGNWRSLQDEPHFQLRPQWAASLAESDMLAELRRRKVSNTDAFA